MQNINSSPDHFSLEANEIVDLKTVEAAIDKGLDFLTQHQYPNGEFCCYVAADEPMQGWCFPDSTVFATMVVASCLLPLSESAIAERMLSKATGYLYGQMHFGRLWPVFSNLHPWHKIVPYDADSLAYGTAFMEERGVSMPSPNNKKLLLANRSRNGLFYTWYIIRLGLQTHKGHWRVSIKELRRPITSLLFWHVNECTRGDIDLGINTNILYYLGDIPETAPIIDAIIKTINECNEHDCDKWYRNPFTIYYLVSRAYNRGVKKLQPVVAPIIERILKTASADGQLGKSILDTALGVISLINFGYTSEGLHKAVDFIIQNQKNHGDWSRWLFYYGGPKLLKGWGSEELTTGFCIESLARYKNEFWCNTN
ncbi:hypothetical protein QTN47_10100 [Danxiaibacter flavus]|uniref:Squalene cyclase C-terminal domain-containing protein n=1 Tax=Danxiaibacter flavus TaxID=3049108 RepID=A0ABV3ZD91_9BACT|nr:hypothetical protein QNM32_10100 [Chitinophagaceae bacterium DXS]